MAVATSNVVSIPLGAERLLILPPEDSSAVRAQRFVRKVLAESDVENDAVNLAVLLTKALVINGLLHARSAIAVTVVVVPESIRIEVADAAVSLSPLNGQDLRLLQGAARSWGMGTISR